MHTLPIATTIKNWMPTLYWELREKFSQEVTCELRHELYTQRWATKDNGQESLSKQNQKGSCYPLQQDVKPWLLSVSILPSLHEKALLHWPCPLSIHVCWRCWKGRLTLCAPSSCTIQSWREGQTSPKGSACCSYCWRDLHVSLQGR